MKYIYTCAVVAIIFFIIGYNCNKCPEQKQYIAIKPYKPNNTKLDSSKQVEIKTREDVSKIVLVPTIKLKKEIKQISTIDTTCIPLISRLTEQIDKRDSIIWLQNQLIDNQQFQIATLLSQKDSCLASNDSLVFESNNLYSEKRNAEEEVTKQKNNKLMFGMGGSLLGLVFGLIILL